MRPPLDRLCSTDICENVYNSIAFGKIALEAAVLARGELSKMVAKSEMADKMTMEQRRDFEWFKFVMPDLYQKYGPCFVSISDRKVTGVYQTYAQAVHAALEQMDYGSFIVQEVGDSADAYTATFTSMWVMP